MNEGGYVKLEDLLNYKLACELSDIGWEIYEPLHWQDKKVMGDQFIESTDSFGANIAEGYGRYHYLDRIKFYYNARGSLFESKHWIKMMLKRKKVSQKECDLFIYKLENALFQHNKYIKLCYNSKK